jgi:hypothetical protein
MRAHRENSELRLKPPRRLKTTREDSNLPTSLFLKSTLPSPEFSITSKAKSMTTEVEFKISSSTLILAPPEPKLQDKPSPPSLENTLHLRIKSNPSRMDQLKFKLKMISRRLKTNSR